MFSGVKLSIRSFVLFMCLSLEKFVIALANCVVSYGVRITYRPDIFLLTFYNS